MPLTKIVFSDTWISGMKFLLEEWLQANPCSNVKGCSPKESNTGRFKNKTPERQMTKEPQSTKVIDNASN